MDREKGQWLCVLFENYDTEVEIEEYHPSLYRAIANALARATGDKGRVEEPPQQAPAEGQDEAQDRIPKPGEDPREYELKWLKAWVRLICGVPRPL